MSILAELNDNLSNLPTVLARFDMECDKVADILELTDTKLIDANKTQSGWQLYYDVLQAELFGLVKFMELRVASIRSKLYVSYTQTHDRDLTEAGKKIYIDGESAYLDMYELCLEVKVMHTKFVGIGNAFKSRGYAINNLTKLAIANITDISY